jgi:hypothetical protein
MERSLTELMLALGRIKFPPEVWRPCQYSYLVAREDWLRRN